VQSRRIRNWIIPQSNCPTLLSPELPRSHSLLSHGAVKNIWHRKCVEIPIPYSDVKTLSRRTYNYAIHRWQCDIVKCRQMVKKSSWYITRLDVVTTPENSEIYYVTLSFQTAKLPARIPDCYTNIAIHSAVTLVLFVSSVTSLPFVAHFSIL
jgi:hypothetical protein